MLKSLHVHTYFTGEKDLSMLVRVLSLVRAKWKEFGRCIEIVQGTLSALEDEWKGNITSL